MKENLPTELPELLRLKIRAGLLQIEHSGKKDTKTCLDEAYHVFARVLSQGGVPISARVLKKNIPAWALRWAIERKWVIYPPQRLRQQWPNFSGKCISSHESVPKEELTVKFGDYMVTEDYKSQIMVMFEVAIAHWEAVIADRVAPAPKVDDAPPKAADEMKQQHAANPTMREWSPAVPQDVGPKRLPSTISSPLAARRMESYLESNPMKRSAFAVQAQTTDRTLRSFRKTGKVRTDIFKNIAKAMDITPEALLKPD